MRKAKILLAFFLTACLMLSIIPLAAFSAVAAAPVADCTVTVQELNVDTADYCVAAYVTFESDTEFTAGTFTVEAAGMTLTDCAVLQSVGGEAPEIDANYAQNTILFTGFSDSTENDFRSYSKLTFSLKFTVEGGFSAIPSGAALTVAVEDVIIGNVDGQRYSTADAEGTVIHVVGGEPGDYVGPEIDPETGEVIVPAHYHTGGTATCHSKAVCTVCGEEYGEFDANNHDGGIEVRDAVAATETEDGYTGDTYCLGCGALIAAGEVIPATGGGEQPASTDMIVWNGAPAYSRLLYRPEEVDPGTKYVLSFDMELTDITEENEPFFWRVFYVTEDDNFVRIPHADFDITKTALKHGYHYDVKFTVPSDCRDYNNILLKFGDTGANGYTQTMKLANLDLWSLDGEDNKVSQIELSIPATVDDILEVTETNHKNNGVNGKWVCPKDYLKNITVEPQNGYFDPIGAYEPGDINGDGAVDNKDLTRLFQYLSNWDVEVNEDALDVNGDGSVDNKDLTRLFQYLSNWDVEIF